MRAEITYDLVMDGDMSFVEGCYRLPEHEWRVFVFSRRGDGAPPRWRASAWESGARGLVVEYPRVGVLDRNAVEAVLGEALGVTEWAEIRGPDSMRLR